MGTPGLQTVNRTTTPRTNATGATGPANAPERTEAAQPPRPEQVRDEAEAQVARLTERPRSRRAQRAAAAFREVRGAVAAYQKVAEQYAKAVARAAELAPNDPDAARDLLRSASQTMMQATRQLAKTLLRNRLAVMEHLTNRFIDQFDRIIDQGVASGLINEAQARSLRSRTTDMARKLAATYFRMLSQLDQGTTTIAVGAAGSMVGGLGFGASGGIYLESSLTGVPKEIGVYGSLSLEGGFNAEISGGGSFAVYFGDSSRISGNAFSVTLGGSDVLGPGLDLQFMFTLGTNERGLPEFVPLGLGLGIGAEAGTPIEVHGNYNYGWTKPLFSLDD